MTTNDEIQRIKDWLKTNQKTQQWLADQLKVHGTTVRKWLTGSLRMPESRLAFIKAIMNAGAFAQLNGRPGDFVFPVCLNEKEKLIIEAAAKVRGLSVEEYLQSTAVQLAEDFAEALLQKEKLIPLKKIASAKFIPSPEPEEELPAPAPVTLGMFPGWNK